MALLSGVAGGDVMVERLFCFYRNFGTPMISLSELILPGCLSGDTKSRWTLISGVFASWKQCVHTSGKNL